MVYVITVSVVLTMNTLDLYNISASSERCPFGERVFNFIRDGNILGF